MILIVMLSRRLLSNIMNSIRFSKQPIGVNYLSKIIDEAFNKIKKISRKKALQKVERKKDNETPLITKFHPNLPSLSKIIKKHALLNRKIP